jgi:uncharacterized membrane protein YccC
MKALALALLVGGWMIAVGGVLAVDATPVRMAMALVGFGTTVAGVLTLNGAHLEHAPWKTRGH